MKKTFFTLACMFFATSIFATTWTVRTTTGAGVDFTSIKSAIDNSSVVDGDILDVMGDFATEQITLSKEITIKGNGTDNTIIRSAGTNRIFISYANGKKFTISDLTIQGGAQSSEPGAAFFIYGAPECVFNNVHFKNMNTTSNGSAMFIDYTHKFTIQNCEFINNKASGVGGCMYITNITGIGLIENSTFEGNGAVNNGWGDAMMLDNGSAIGDSLLVRNCTFYNNGKDNVGLGGTIAINYGNIKVGIVNNTFASNRGNDNVGDLFLISNSGWPTKLNYIGNLFYNSRGIIVPNNYPNNALVAYNLSTSVINVQEGLPNITYNPLKNGGSLTAGTDLKIELNGGLPFLTDNGGMVRTLKLLGATSSDNLAIGYINEPIGSQYDARGVARKLTTQDCGAYEVTGGVTTSLNTDNISKRNFNVRFNSKTSTIIFDEKVTGLVTVSDLRGAIQISKEINASEIVNVSGAMAGVYLVSLKKYNGETQTTKIVVTR